MTTAEVKAVFDVLRPGADGDRPRGGRARRRLVPRGRLPDRDPAGVPRRRPARLRLRGRRLPARPDRAPLRDDVLAHRHPDDDALQADEPARALGRRCTRPATASPTRAPSRRSARSPLYGNASLGLGESQSRTWENLVGRSLPFWRGRLAELQRLFPQLESVDLDTWYRGINRVAPGLIRVDADEVTYSLHIILRFELEQELVAGTLALDDLPEAWNAKMSELLGVDVPDDARGVLQDVHWTRASYGYFPTYALGNVLSVQIWRAVEEELRDLDAQLEAGEFGPLYESLRRRIYRHGRKFTPMETLERAIGADGDRPAAVPRVPALQGRRAPARVGLLHQHEHAPRARRGWRPRDGRRGPRRRARRRTARRRRPGGRRSSARRPARPRRASPAAVRPSRSRDPGRETV